MKVQIISRETVKPSSPTPPRLRTFKLSLLDQLVPPIYASNIFFYPFISNNPERIPTAKRSDQLKKSLSETLSRYYPFAGRFKDGGFSIIDCNDEGADYIEAHVVNCELSKFLEKPEIEVLNRFLPHDFATTALDHNAAQLSIQVNNFACGGLAIGICFLHKIMDAISTVKFVNDWASMARCSNEPVSPPPVFLQDSVYRSRDLSGLFQNINVESSITTKTGRFVFTGSSIDALKAKVSINVNSISTSSMNRLTRVEVVSSLIWQRIMAAFRAKPGSKRLPFVARHMVNVRGRAAPPLPGNSIGNMIWDTNVSLKNERESKLVDLILQLREAIGKINSEYLRELQGDEWFSKLLEAEREEQLISESDSCTFSSMCRMPLYEADFGWGKPAWVSYFDAAMAGTGNEVLLMDTKHGDGIEAWVTSDEQTMEVLERDEDLLAFASSNPSVINGIVFNRSSL